VITWVYVAGFRGFLTATCFYEDVGISHKRIARIFLFLFDLTIINPFLSPKEPTSQMIAAS
jgi:hypothetical protein